MSKAETAYAGADDQGNTATSKSAEAETSARDATSHGGRAEMSTPNSTAAKQPLIATGSGEQRDDFEEQNAKQTAHMYHSARPQDMAQPSIEAGHIIEQTNWRSGSSSSTLSAKRSTPHDEDDLVTTSATDMNAGSNKRPRTSDAAPGMTSLDQNILRNSLRRDRLESPAVSEASSLTDCDQLAPQWTPKQMTPNGLPTLSATSMSPATKRKGKLTAAEKQAKAAEKEARAAERAAEKAQKALRDEEKAAEKARLQAEKDAKRKQREEEANAKEERKRIKAEEKRKAEEEKQRIEDEKRKKDGVQKTLGSFFAVPGPKSSPVATAATASTKAPSVPTTPSKPKDDKTYYKVFPPFFVHDDVDIAPICRFERDTEATEAAIVAIEACLLGEAAAPPLDVAALLRLHSLKRRGKTIRSLRSIMGESDVVVVTTSSSSQSQSRPNRDQLRINVLRATPLKTLKFAEDVRPAYHGTFTQQPLNGLPRLARNPLRRDHPTTDYAYDSEAEWVEDEDAEDCESVGGDEDEENDNGEDMADFLDDENDELLNSRRMVVQSDLVPVSSGMCWEDHRKRNVNVKMMAYRMEIIDLGVKSIDPFSYAYWPDATSTAASEPVRVPLHTMKSANANASMHQFTSTKHHPHGTDAIKKVKQTSILLSSTSLDPSSPLIASPSASEKPTTAAPTSSKPTPRLLDAADLPAFCQAVQGSDMNKVMLIEVLKKRFPGRGAAAIKATLDHLARREGKKEVDKRWVLREGPV